METNVLILDLSVNFFYNITVENSLTYVFLMFTKFWNVNKAPWSSGHGMEPKAVLMLLSKGPAQQIKCRCLTIVHVFGFRGFVKRSLSLTTFPINMWLACNLTRNIWVESFWNISEPFQRRWCGQPHIF